MFKIGKFSKLTQVSVRMLRYYDENGRIRPPDCTPRPMEYQVSGRLSGGNTNSSEERVSRPYLEHVRLDIFISSGASYSALRKY